MCRRPCSNSGVSHRNNNRLRLTVFFFHIWKDIRVLCLHFSLSHPHPHRASRVFSERDFTVKATFGFCASLKRVCFILTQAFPEERSGVRRKLSQTFLLFHASPHCSPPSQTWIHCYDRQTDRYRSPSFPSLSTPPPFLTPSLSPFLLPPSLLPSSLWPQQVTQSSDSLLAPSPPKQKCGNGKKKGRKRKGSGEKLLPQKIAGIPMSAVLSVFTMTLNRAATMSQPWLTLKQRNLTHEKHARKEGCSYVNKQPRNVCVHVCLKPRHLEFVCARVRECRG